MINEVQEILINESEIQEKVKYLAEQINKDYAGKDIVLMIILKGSVVFSADLMRYLNVNVSLDFMQVSSYGSSSVSGELKILKDGQIDVNGKNVIIAEDIIDSGNTLSALVKLLKNIAKQFIITKMRQYFIQRISRLSDFIVSVSVVKQPQFFKHFKR